MAAEKIGPAKCPLCGGTASVSLSKARLCVLTCNGCNSQLFTRSDRSDELVRDLLIKGRPAAPDPVPEKPAAPAVVTPPAEPPDPVRTEETPKPKRSPFALLGASDD